MCSHFLVVQDRNSRSREQSRIRNYFIGRRLENGRHNSITIEGVVFWKHVRIPMQREIFSASGKRNSLVLSVDSLSVVLLDKTFQRAHSQPGRLFIFEDNGAVFLMAIERRNPNWKRVSRTHRVDLDRLFERTNVDHSISIRYVNTTEQLAHNLTLGASTTILVKSLMRLVDIDPPPKLDFNRSISESSCSAVSSFPFRGMSDAYGSKLDFESGPWDEKLEEPSYRVVNQRSFWENFVRSTEVPSSSAR